MSDAKLEGMLKKQYYLKVIWPIWNNMELDEIVMLRDELTLI